MTVRQYWFFVNKRIELSPQPTPSDCVTLTMVTLLQLQNIIREVQILQDARVCQRLQEPSSVYISTNAQTLPLYHANLPPGIVVWVCKYLHHS